jgi:hypothetical protein
MNTRRRAAGKAGLAAYATYTLRTRGEKDKKICTLALCLASPFATFATLTPRQIAWIKTPDKTPAPKYGKIHKRMKMSLSTTYETDPKPLSFAPFAPFV